VKAADKARPRVRAKRQEAEEVAEGREHQPGGEAFTVVRRELTRKLQERRHSPLPLPQHEPPWIAIRVVAERALPALRRERGVSGHENPVAGFFRH